MGRRNLKVSIPSWKVESYLLAEDRLLRYMDSGVDGEAFVKYLEWLEPEDIRKHVVALFNQIRTKAPKNNTYFDVGFHPDLIHFFWLTHRFLFDRECMGHNHPLESMGLPYYVALWGLVDHIWTQNDPCVRLVYEEPSL